MMSMFFISKKRFEGVEPGLSASDVISTPSGSVKQTARVKGGRSRGDRHGSEEKRNGLFVKFKHDSLAADLVAI